MNCENIPKILIHNSLNKMFDKFTSKDTFNLYFTIQNLSNLSILYWQNYILEMPKEI
jgi:hypothetical protein